MVPAVKESLIPLFIPNVLARQ